MASALKYDEEDKMDALFADIKAIFKKLESTPEGKKTDTLVKDLGTKLQEAKTYVKIVFFIQRT
jgi:hypothetical protein